MSTLAERFTQALLEAKKTHPELSKIKLAQHCGVRPPTVTDWFNGKTRTISGSYGLKAAEFLGVSAPWLISGVGEAHPPKVVLSEIDVNTNDIDLIGISEYEVTGLASDNSHQLTFGTAKDSEKAWYSSAWFRSKRIKPQLCKRFRVRDKSMEPVIWEGDSILVECGIEQIVSGKIYVFWIDGHTHVKYLYNMIDGSILVKSLNPAMPDEIIKTNEIYNFVLIGRVRERSGDRIF